MRIRFGSKTVKRLAASAALTACLLLGASTSCGGGGNVDGKLSIAVIPMGTTHEFWKAIHAGAVKASQELDVEIVWKGPQREDDRSQQIAIIEDMISRGVDGIVLAPLDRTGLRQVVGEAKRAGIPTLCVDSGLKEGDDISLISTDNYKGGVIGAQRLAEVLNGKGNVILMRVNIGMESTRNREDGFLEEIKRYPDIKILSDNQYGGVTTETSYQVGENLLNRFSDVDGIFCPNESTTFGMLRALTDAAKNGKIKFVGFDSSKKLIDALEAGDLQGLVLQNPFQMGYLGTKTIVDYLRDPNQATPERIDTGVTVATPENMHQPEIQALLRPPVEQYLD